MFDYFYSKAIAGKLEFDGKVSFFDNLVDGSVGGAIYLISSSQMLLYAGTHLKFINNTGRYSYAKCSYICVYMNPFYRSGAAIVAEVRNSLSVFNKQFFNPLCFLQYYKSSVPFSEVAIDEVSGYMYRYKAT